MSWRRRANASNEPPRSPARAGPVLAELARLYARQGDADAARAAAEAARELPDLVPVDDPLLTEVWDAAVSARGTQQRALRAEAAGDFETAEALYDRLLGLQPGDPDILYNLATSTCAPGASGKPPNSTRRRSQRARNTSRRG